MIAGTWLSLLLFSCLTYGKTIFVDQNILSKTCTHYNIGKRDCSGTQPYCYQDIQSAIRASEYGNSILIREGFYAESVVGDLSTDKSGDQDFIGKIR